MFKVERNAFCFDNLIIQELIDILESVIPSIIEVITDEYNSKLVGRVTDRNSKTRPDDYFDEFKEALENFIEVEYNDTAVFINIPDMDNFKFDGRLKVLKTILEGVVGIYAEVSVEDYEKLFGKNPVSVSPFDSSVPKSEMVYLMRYDAKLRMLERDKLDKKLVIYPFSNAPSVDIFEAANTFYDNNIDGWINKAVDKAQDRYEKECF